MQPLEAAVFATISCKMNPNPERAFPTRSSGACAFRQECMNTPHEVLPKRKWLGVILSLLVPGFGVLRAGMHRRAALWFFALYLAGILTGICFAVNAVSFPVALCMLTAFIIAYVWMLFDSFRPGRMNFNRWILFLGILVAIIFLPDPISLVALPYKVSSGAMEPTLNGGQSEAASDHVIVSRLAYLFGAPNRGDIVVFSTSQIPSLHRHHVGVEGEVYFIMRVVGLPGERISISDGDIFANGNLLDKNDGIPSSIAYREPIYIPHIPKLVMDDFSVGPEQYFVLGDNSSNSFDSRYWGTVPMSSIQGKVTGRYYPFHRAGRSISE